MTDPLEPVRQGLLEAALAHVPFDGWSAKALDLAATDRGIDPGRARVAFPGGVNDLIRYFARNSDQRMRDGLATRDLTALRIRESIALAVKLRLEALNEYREAVRRLIAHQSLPQNMRPALVDLFRTVDAMWSAIGDRSADFSYYTKRALLAGVYSSTLLYWLSDESEDFADTWSFLERRIDNVMSIQKVRGRFDAMAACLPSASRIAGRFRYPGGRTG
ncbi:MAG: COQ9 family protein [Sphingomonadales bacterium]